MKFLYRILQIQLHMLFLEWYWVKMWFWFKVRIVWKFCLTAIAVEILLRCHLRDLKVVLFSRCQFHCHEFSRSFVLTYRSKIEILEYVSLLPYPYSVLSCV